MVLSKRERLIAIGVALAVLLFGFDYFVLEPYLAARTQVDTDLTEVVQQTADASVLFARQTRLKRIWAELQDGGLKVDPSQADSQTFANLVEWTRLAGVTQPGFKSERSSQEGKFEVISYSVTGNGSLASMAKLLWSLETTTIPLRINEVQITPTREGTDNLALRLSVSSLCMPPDSPTKLAASNGDR